MKNAICNTMMLILISLAACSMLVTCDNPMSAEKEVIGNGGGLITVTIGGGNARKILSWANALDSSQLTHKITVSDGNGGQHFGTIGAGGGSVRFSVIPGIWNITVEARYYDDLIAVGEIKEQIIKHGDNGTINVQMKEPDNFPCYTVTFYSNGGSKVEKQKIKKYNNNTATRPTPPTNEGYGFVNWYTDDTFQTPYDFDVLLTSDIDLYALWSDTIFIVTFNLNDNNAVHETQTVGEGGKATRPTNPTRNGYVFANWYSDMDFVSIFDFDTPVNDNIVLYAKWLPQFTVTFHSNGGSSVPAQTVTQGEMAIRPENPTRSGYGFIRWCSDETLKTEYDFTNPIFENIDLYAYWSETIYTVTFHGNGGVPETTNKTVGEGGTATPPDNNPTRDSFYFDGWYRDAGCNQEYNFEDEIYNDTNLYAKWLPQYTVIFNSNGGSFVSTQTVTLGSKATRPADPAWSGYGFVKWCTDEYLNAEYNFSAPVTANITLYAKWNAIINIAPIQGVAVPVTSAIPVTTIPETAQYTGTVTWNGNPSAFAPETVYTATITLTAKNGCTLQGVAANFFTVAGATSSSNSANSGVVTAVFPATLPFVVEMVHVPSGSFQMGEPNTDASYAENGNTKPVHQVTLTGFYMGKYLVTQEQYEAVMGTNPSHFNGSQGKEPVNGETQERRPVEMVSWYDAIVFCNKLSKAEGLTPAYRLSDHADPVDFGTVPTGSDDKWDKIYIVAGSNGYRLPTEAQWEYAAKGGNGTPGDYKYSGSNDVDNVAWYSLNSGDKTHEVGKKAPNGLGLYDMTGNVWDWCWDWYGGYSGEAQADPTGASSGTVRVARGGCFNNSATQMYSAFRLNNTTTPNYPYGRYNGIGFRLVRPE